MISNDINHAVEMLNKNEVVAIPTETVYGLAGNAFSEEAIAKIFSIKKRPKTNPLIVHIHGVEELDKIAINIPEKAKQLAAKFWPGPLTLILDKNPSLSSSVTAGNSKVAVRVPNHPIALDLLKKLSFPLVAPSANPFGSISPTSSEHVFNYFRTTIPIILEGGNSQKGVESTIIGFESNQPVLYRLGAIPLEEIENEIGTVKLANNEEEKPLAPGMLSRHYAPQTDTYLTNDVNALIGTFQGKKIGVLLFSNRINNKQIIHTEVLSEHANLEEAAQNLYAALHRLDKINADVIIAELMPNNALGKTINDRLNRAVKKN